MYACAFFSSSLKLSLLPIIAQYLFETVIANSFSHSTDASQERCKDKQGIPHMYGCTLILLRPSVAIKVATIAGKKSKSYNTDNN